MTGVEFGEQARIVGLDLLDSFNDRVRVVVLAHAIPIQLPIINAETDGVSL